MDLRTGWLLVTGFWQHLGYATIRSFETSLDGRLRLPVRVGWL